MIFRAVVQVTGMPSEVVPGDSMERRHAATAIAASPACDLEVATSVGAAEAFEVVASVVVVEAVEVVAVVAGKCRESWYETQRRTDMKSILANAKCWRRVSIWYAVACACLSATVLYSARPSTARTEPPTPATSSAGAKLFDTPQQAADTLVNAAEKFDVAVLTEIFGPDGNDVVFSGEFAQDRKRAADFTAQAHEKTKISVDRRSGNRAFVLVGNEDWPFPIPLVKKGEKWFFDSKAGRRELLYRRIGANEQDAIAICRGYVDAQNEYALQPRTGYDVNQYAQRIVSTPGKQDGLAWQNPDGTWSGPIGENIARAIEQGYSTGAEPYHGYFFKILKGQGVAAPLGEMDFVVKGIMIGGFALVAAPAEYSVTGVRTFMVSHDGIVYEKDLGSKTLDVFKKMELFNPDASWTPVSNEED